MSLRNGKSNGRAPTQHDWEALSRNLCKMRRREHELTNQIAKIEREATDSGKRRTAAAPQRKELDPLRAEIEQAERMSTIMLDQINALKPAPALTPQARVRLEAITPPPSTLRGGSAEQIQAARAALARCVDEEILGRGKERDTAKARITLAALEADLDGWHPWCSRADIVEERKRLGLMK